MKIRNLRNFNLNALPALLEILRQGSLTKAATTLNITQPALSNILKQLRFDFDDQLIVRSGQAMRLTPKGAALLAPLEQSLASVEQVLVGNDFDPAVSKRCFRIATNDHIMAMLGAPLTATMLTHGPHMATELVTAGSVSVKQLLIGDIDMIITPKALMSGGPSDDEILKSVSAELLFQEALVCIGPSADNALAAGLQISDYLARPHIGFAFGDGQLGSMEQVQLARQGYRQRNMLLVASYAVMPKIVAQTGCLALVPESFAEQALGQFDLQSVRPPVLFPPLEWMMVWHKRNDANASMHWLRAALLQSVATLSR
jgi:LysR family transcriptional regulator, nod-box dependent transcriptional activator